MRLLDKISVFTMHGLFMVLMLMSIFLYKERLFADAAYYFFHMTNSSGFHVEHGRIVLALAQLFPLIGVWLSFPLKVVMVMSSLGHELFYYSIFLFLLYGLKNRLAALGLLLIHVIGQLWLYYSPMYEICYGAALTLLFYTLLSSGKLKDDKWLIALLLVEWFSVTSHLENTVLVFFVILYDMIERGFEKRVHLSVLSLLGIGILLEFLTLTSYEKHNISNSFDESASYLNLFKSDYILQLVDLFTTYFPELVIFGSIAVLVMIINKQWKKVIIYLGAVSFLIVIINNKANAIEFIRYFESMYNPLVLLTVFVIIFEVVRRSNSQLKSMMSLLLVFVAIVRVSWIWSYGEPLRKRTSQLERIVDATQLKEHSKYIIEKENFEKSYSFVNWATPIEALLFSAIDGSKESITIATPGDIAYNNNKAKLTEQNFVFRRFELMDIDELNPKYYVLEKQDYKPLNTAALQDNYSELKDRVIIVPLNINNNFKLGDTTWVTVEVQLPEGLKLPSSISSNMYLSYHWYRYGQIYNWDGIRTPLELDIVDRFRQDVKVAMPEEEGVYDLEFDLVIEGKEWFKLKGRTKIFVEKFT